MIGQDFPDYELLAKAAYRGWHERETVLMILRAEDAARAVVAALRDQGFCVARSEAIRSVADIAEAWIPASSMGLIYDELKELKAAAALAAPNENKGGD